MKTLSLKPQSPQLINLLEVLEYIALGVRLGESRTKSVEPVWDTILVVLEIN